MKKKRECQNLTHPLSSSGQISQKRCIYFRLRGEKPAHHLETVFSDLPSCSDSQRLVFPCSAKAAYHILLIVRHKLMIILLQIYKKDCKTQQFSHK